MLGAVVHTVLGGWTVKVPGLQSSWYTQLFKEKELESDVQTLNFFYKTRKLWKAYMESNY